MSESTTDTGQVELAPDPSMEDILASIRKIIADDDQPLADVADGTMSTSPEIPSVADMLEAETAPVSLVSDELAQSGSDDLSGDVMDLDIEALLNDADRTVEAETPPSPDQNVSGITQDAKTDETGDDSDALFDMVELELTEDDILSEDLTIPDIPEAETVSVATKVLSEDISVVKEESRPLEEVKTDEASDDVDSLFNDLENLLSEGSDDQELDAMLDVPLGDTSEAKAVDIDETPKAGKTGLFSAGLAAVGLSKLNENATEDIVTVSEDATPLETDDDLDAILSDLTMEQPSVVKASNETSAVAASALQTDSNDMDLVKSLMADLTEPEPALSAETQVEVASTEELTVSSDLEALDAKDVNTDDVETDFLDEILDMSLDDEIKAHKEEVASVIATNETSENTEEIDIVAEESLEISDTEPSSLSDVVMDEETNIQAEEEMSLLDIAASAEQEAERIENLRNMQRKASEDIDIPAIIEGPNSDEVTEDLGLETGLTAGVLSAAAVLAASKAKEKREETSESVHTEETISKVEDDVSKYVVEVAPVMDKTSEELSDSQEEPADMPRAATAEKSDAILDDVTKTATSEVFASLNQVVEEKAIQAERGDRVGDLVMEALRPMLKEWLDANLKGIVERAVSKEVKRISSGK